MRRFVGVCVCLLALVGCKKSSDQEDITPLIVITSPDNPPFEFKDTAQGGDEVIGFDMDMAQKLSEHLGRPVKIMEADFSAIIPALQSGRADMAISTLSPTPERCKSVDFSDPYYQQDVAFLVLEGCPITSPRGLENKVLGVQMGSTHENTGQALIKKIPALSVVSLNKGGELVQELKNKRIDAILTETCTAQRIAAATPGLKVVPLEIEGEKLAIAFPKGSPWVKVVNEKLKNMQKDLKTLTVKWFKTE